MKKFFLVALITFPLCAFAQQKEIAKTDKYLAKGQQDKLKKYVQDLRKKDHKSAVPDYLVSKWEYHIYRKSGIEKHLHKSLDYLNKSSKKSDKESLEWETSFIDSVYFYVRNQYEAFHEEHTNKRKFYGNCLVSLFNDSIHIYTDNPKTGVVGLNIEPSHLSANEKELRKNLISFAEQFVGTPYKWAGEKPEHGGFDCSGFVLYTFQNHDIILPHSARMIADSGQHVTRENLQPGDVVAFGSIKSDGKPNVYHIGIVYQVEGELKVIHSVSRGVIIDSLEPDQYWHKNILFFRKLISM